MSSIRAVLIVVSVLVLAQGARKRADLAESTLALSAADRPVCDDEIVAEACLVLNGGEKHAQGDDWISSTTISDLFCATPGSMTDFWNALELPTERPTADGMGHWIECAQLCSTVKDYVGKVGVLPNASDVGCYNVDGKTLCDLPMDPASLPALGPQPGVDMPDFGDKGQLHNTSFGPPAPGSFIEERRSEDVSYGTWEMAERIANIFRFYPAEKPEPVTKSRGSNPYNNWPAGGEQKHAQKLVQSKAYMTSVIRAFNQKSTQSHITQWFGSRAFNDASSRREILRVLNSVDHMISNVEAVYEGPQCSSNTYAYVYPKAYSCSSQSELKRSACTKYNGKFVFYLCSLYLRRESEMVETLVHEGSHHATSYTDDVDFRGMTAYGRSTCQALARSEPSKALKNADNYCYYIQDVAQQAGGSGSDNSHSAGRCPQSAYRTTPDSDGDCKCSSGRSCRTSSSYGCPWSSGGSSTTYFSVTCTDCRCS